jgi:hypothetical protein
MFLVFSDVLFVTCKFLRSNEATCFNGEVLRGTFVLYPMIRIMFQNKVLREHFDLK